MIRFRPNLSAHNIIIKTELNNARDTADIEAILRIGLMTAFDNVTHKAILEKLQKLYIYLYVCEVTRAYHVKQLIRGKIRSDDVELKSRQTPWGLVLSPFLLNVALLHLFTLTE